MILSHGIIGFYTVLLIEFKEPQRFWRRLWIVLLILFLVINGFIRVAFGGDAYMLVAAFTLTLPYLLIILWCSRYKGLRVVFCACTCLWMGCIADAAGLIAQTILGDNSWIRLAVRVAVYIALYLVLRLLRPYYLRMLRILDYGWGVLCFIPAVTYLTVLYMVGCFLPKDPVAVTAAVCGITALSVCAYILIYLFFMGVRQSYELKNSRDLMKAQILTFEQGDTYGDLYEAARNYNPSNPSDQLKIEKFNLSERYLEIYPEDQEISVSPGEILYIRMYADYGEKAVVPISVRYVDENRLYKKINEAAVVDKGISYQDIFEEYIPEKPESYEGLKFKEWDVYIPEGTVQGSDMEISGSAEYSNYLVRFLIDDIFEGEEYIDWNYDDESQDYDYVYCIVAEPGETITLPTKFEGYDSVTWIDQYAWPEDNKLTVDFDITYRGYGEKTATDPSDPEKPVDPEEPTDPEKPVDPEEPSNPEEPSKPEKPSNPGTEIPADTVDSVVQEIEGTSASSTVQVDMGNATVLSKEILEAAKGKDVNIQLNMGSYTWTINGKDIKASDLKDIDMKVTMNTDAIPSSVVKKLAGDDPTMQLSLAHEGDFGFQAKLTLNVGSQYAGKFGNLYYYDSDGKLVYINSGKVAESGNVSLTFSHASDYVVVLADQQYISKGDGQNGASNTSGNEGTTQRQSGADVVKTGDSAPTATLLIVMGAAVVVIAGAVIVKKRGSAK